MLKIEITIDQSSKCRVEAACEGGKNSTQWELDRSLELLEFIKTVLMPKCHATSMVEQRPNLERFGLDNRDK